MVAAVTHDDEWILAMGEESAVPPGFQLISRIRAKCTLDFDYGGVFLREKTAESPGNILPTFPRLEIGVFSTILWFCTNIPLLLAILLVVSFLTCGPSANWVDGCLIILSISPYAVYRQRPVTEVNRLSDTIKTTDEMLRSITKPKRLFPPILSAELVERAKVKIWECKMQRQRLETFNAAEWRTYFRRARRFMQDVDESQKAVGLVRRDTRRVIGW
ncbi:hypothetical protein B0H14DRAFT_2737405 [Mycena olivaceomarginata]|nr:hypothetical protein B0H14DRAFT_2737405 [Mycena olivaceomarginata]